MTEPSPQIPSPKSNRIPVVLPRSIAISSSRKNDCGEAADTVVHSERSSSHKSLGLLISRLARPEPRLRRGEAPGVSDRQFGARVEGWMGRDPLTDVGKPKGIRD